MLRISGEECREGFRSAGPAVVSRDDAPKRMIEAIHRDQEAPPAVLIGVELVAQEIARAGAIFAQRIDKLMRHRDIEPALALLQVDMDDAVARARKRALQVILPTLRGIEQPHEESGQTVEGLERKKLAASGLRCLRNPNPVLAVVVRSFSLVSRRLGVAIATLVVMAERDSEGRRVRQHVIEKVNREIAGQAAVAEQAKPQ